MWFRVIRETEDRLKTNVAMWNLKLYLYSRGARRLEIVVHDLSLQHDAHLAMNCILMSDLYRNKTARLKTH